MIHFRMPHFRMPHCSPGSRPCRRAAILTGLAALWWAAVVSAQSPSPAPAQAATLAAAPRPAPVRTQPVPPQVDAVFKAWDTDHNGSLSQAEFRTGWSKLRRVASESPEARLREQFQRIDANRNGGIDRTEYPNLVLVKQAGASAPPFSEFDRNGDQKLDFAEYAALVQRLGGTRRPAAAPAGG